MTEFSGWANFYVIVGSSAGALIGLQFVVMTLIANMPLAGKDMEAGEVLRRRLSFISEPCFCSLRS